MKIAGLILFVAGAVSFGVGLWWIYPPACLLVSGSMAMYFARMAWKEAGL